MNALAGDAVLFVAIAAATGFTELRARSALRSIQNDFAKVRSMLALFDARRAALESRKNGGDHLAVNAIDAGSSYETRRLDAKTARSLATIEPFISTSLFGSPTKMTERISTQRRLR